jgi:hypothetical protein
MNEKLIIISRTLTDPDSSAGLTTGAGYFMLPVSATLVYAAAAPYEDDTGATISLKDDGTDILTGLDVSDKDVPGVWKSTHFGGTNDPVRIAKDSEMSIDVLAGAVANRFDVDLWFLVGVS